MKIKTKKLKVKVDPADLAIAVDELGENYVSYSERLKTAAAQRAEVAQRIKDVAAEVGETHGDQTIVHGRSFIIGYSTVAPRKEVDWKAFFKAFPKFKEKLTDLLVNEKKVEDALRNGSLQRKLLLKFIINKPNAKPTNRIIVKEVGKHGKKYVD